MIRTLFTNGADLGPISLRSTFEIPTGRSAVSADENGQPIYKAEGLMGGHVAGRTDRQIGVGSCQIKVLGAEPTVIEGLVVLEGLVQITQWTNGRGAGLRSEVTVTAEGVRQAVDGEYPTFDREIPCHIPARVYDRQKETDLPVGMRFLTAVDRGNGALYRWGIDVVIDPVGPWKVDGLGQFDSATRPPLEWVGKKIRPVGLGLRWYVPETASSYDKAALLISAQTFELDEPTNGHHHGNGNGGGRKPRETPVPVSVGAPEPSEG